MRDKKMIMMATAVVMVLVAAAVLCWVAFGPKGTDGMKTLTVDVIHKDGSQKTFTVETEAAFLGDALSGVGILEGDQAAYGMFVRTVDGEAVDESNQEWWGYTRSGAYVEYGVDLCPILDGEHYEFTFHIGW